MSTIANTTIEPTATTATAAAAEAKRATKFRYAKYAAATVGVIAAGAALVGCTGNEVSTPGGAVDASGNGEWSAIVDGEEVTLDDAAVVCAEQAGIMSIMVASQTADEASGLSASINAETLAVDAVGMGSTETGELLAYAPGVPGAEADATNDGNRWEVTGTIVSADMNDPMGGMTEKPFELSVTCP